MESFYKLFAKAAFFFIVGVVLASLFVWCLLEGALVHTSGNSSLAISYYFVAWLSGVAALTLYLQAKTLFHYAKITE